MESRHLGATLSEHSGAKAGRRDVTTGVVILALIIGIGGLALSITKAGQHALGYLVLGSLVAGLAAFIASGLRNLRLRVEICEGGMVIRDGDSYADFRWDEIASLTGMLPTSFNGRPFNVGGPLVIRLNDGRKFRLGVGIDGLDGLANLVYEKSRDRVTPTLEAIRRGGSAEFGALRVDRTGLAHGEQFLPWQELQRISITPNALVIVKRGAARPWLTIRLNQVDNANILIEVSQALRTG